MIRPPVFGKVFMQLQDQFSRKFYYLRLSITDVCNFKCNYCLPDGYKADGKPEFLGRDELRRIVTGFAEMGTEKVRITGG
ncbi:MAG: cyclic pyranopterin phosphate synthase, partial [Candidatus Omnitrophota bacterium]